MSRRPGRSSFSRSGASFSPPPPVSPPPGRRKCDVRRTGTTVPYLIWGRRRLAEWLITEPVTSEGLDCR